MFHNLNWADVMACAGQRRSHGIGDPDITNWLTVAQRAGRGREPAFWAMMHAPMAIIGLTVVAEFVAVRAVGFHHFDSLINTQVMDVRFNFIFEVSGRILAALTPLSC